MRVQDFSYSETAIEQAAQHVVTILEQGGTLFVSGGSSFAVFQEVDTILSDHQKSQVSLLLADERYGLVGHADSNWELFAEINLDNYASATPVLKNGLSIEQTAEDFGNVVMNALTLKHTVAILGIGADRHVAGIKPMTKDESQQTLVNKLVVGYKGPDFERITITFDALREIDSIVVFVAGSDKQLAVQGIEDKTELYEAPANILNELNDVNIYNVNQKTGEKL